MAILKNGIDGAFSGKIGTAVGTTWRGLKIIRSRPKPPTQFSEKQLVNQMKMKVAQDFLRRMVEPIRIGFRDDTIVPTAYNIGLSYLKRHALTGEYPNISVDFPAVKIAQGLLAMPDDIQIEAEGGQLMITWSAITEGNARHDDQLMIVLWNDTDKTSQYILQAYRSAGQFNWQPGFEFAGSHAWAAFIRQDRSMQGESVYLGQVI
jgi:hypothetical protein